ncbi:VanZ family protein [Nocardioides sp. KIGAM211]|uniref:VanZ family protein n=1 Tax=Nocardioides luti TaxID=2761101 RepID=A0A7X0VC01_9ACTN|nr:VanZ family protein [Nocardioides luti]MBB6628482.1 VanZ family protein [Nocardioides luti]
MAPVRLVSAALLVAYAVALAVVLMEYNPLVATDVVARFGYWLQGHGASAAMTEPARVEFLLNAAMFAPVAFLAALALPRQHWATWVVWGFVLSGAVELLQGVLLPPRSAQFEDVVANTLGALVGAVASLPVARVMTKR